MPMAVSSQAVRSCARRPSRTLKGERFVPAGEVAARLVGDHFWVADPIEIQRRIRRRIDEAGLSADVAADVNIVVNSGGGTASTASSVQHAPIHQGRSSRAARAAPEPKEQP